MKETKAFIIFISLDKCQSKFFQEMAMKAGFLKKEFGFGSYLLFQPVNGNGEEVIRINEYSERDFLIIDLWSLPTKIKVILASILTECGVEKSKTEAFYT